ncbi:hypothetical protein KXQ82_03280 [Mucilaginibacter sp. HMF5004]|uniref:hypothetical protein n=1 Tax=Mucilaginibacter rivuli TaxID=2857527 RepID=UPI001C5E2C3D|nr:hypothetical protein [Mucilaginibacter rivuli]MBW4888716.1 hypothetical protein [Mucilaginibacter rivuli]
MKQQEIFKKIGTILNELNEQYQFIEKTKDDINDLELELFAANTHYLSENIEVLRKHNKQRAVPLMPEEAPPFTEKFFEPVVQPAQIFWPEKKDEAEKAEDVITFEEPVIEEAPAEEPIIRHELILSDVDYLDDDEEATAVEEVSVNAVEETSIVTVAEEIPVVEPVKETPKETVKEEPSKPASTINQIIAAQMANPRLADQFDLPEIKDIKSAINLNDKLLYVKDLFNGYSMAYGEAIEILNRFNKFDEADTFLKNNYVKKNNWESKQATADKFYTLLRRRYPN